MKKLVSRLPKIPKTTLAILVLFALAYQSQAIWFKTSDNTNLLAGLFLGVAFLYRGSSRLWWRLFVPLGGILLFVPVAVIETRSAAVSIFLKSALLPCLSFLIGSLLAPFVESKSRSSQIRENLKNLSDKNTEFVSQVKTLENDIKDFAAGNFKTAMVTEEFLAGGAFRASALIQTLTYSEIHQIVKASIEELREKHSGWKTLRLVLTSAADLSFPLAVRADRESITTVTHSLLENALDALGGGEGVVRVTLKPSMTFVNLLVEDNGRGLGERAKGTVTALTLIEVRALSESIGWDMDIQARLGVGTRVSLELPRVDGEVRAGQRPHRSRDLSTHAEESGSLLV